MPLELRRGGNALRNRRKSLGLTIEEVTKATGLETSDISRLENGRVTSPSLDKVIRYSSYLGFTPGEIAAEYGLWTMPVGGRTVQLAHQLEKLPAEEQIRVMDMVDSLVRAAIHDHITRKTGTD